MLMGRVPHFLQQVQLHISKTMHIIIISGNTIGVLVTSSRIDDISAEANVYLNLVLIDGRVFSNVLTHCGSLLTGIITIPSISFQFQLEGSDSERNRFKTHVGIRNVTVTGTVLKKGSYCICTYIPIYNCK